MGYQEGEYTQICGYAFQPNPDTDPGKLKVKFPVSPVPGDYFILDTDYDNYSCVYSCNEYIGKVQIYVWILSRSIHPSDEMVKNNFFSIQLS